MNRKEFVILSAASASTVSLTNWVKAQSSKANPTSVQSYKSINHLLEINLELEFRLKKAVGNTSELLFGRK